MGLQRRMYLVHFLRPTGILYWILVSTVPGHSRSVTSHKVKSELVKSYKEKTFFAKKFKESLLSPNIQTWRQEI